MMGGFGKFFYDKSNKMANKTNLASYKLNPHGNIYTFGSRGREGIENYLVITTER